MKYVNSVLVLVLTYLLVQGLGLWIAAGGPLVGEGVVEVIENNPELGIVEDPSSLESTGQIVLYIFFATIVLLLLIKFKFDLIIKIFMNLAILGGLFLTLGALLDYIGLGLALVMFALRLWKQENIFLMNLVLVFTVPGIGSWIGASIDAFPTAFILLLALAVYDVVAVFGTKHMVALADAAEKGRGSIPMMFAIPVEERTLGLGTGDLAMPLVFCVSLLRQYSIETAAVTVLGGLLGLLVLFFYVTKKKDVVLPALPPITAGTLLGFAVATLVF